MAKGGVDRVTRWEPLAVQYPTYVPPPTDAQVAKALRTRAARLCAMRQLGPCRDMLDNARDLDPVGEQTREVQELRSFLENPSGNSPRDDLPPQLAKPPVGPRETPLPPRPRSPAP